MANSRIEAVRLLCKIEKNNLYSPIALAQTLKKLNFTDDRDFSFVAALVYGTLEHKITLDYNINLYLSLDINKLRPTVLNILRVAAFQILYMDRAPVSAAVNEAVKSSDKLGVLYAAGFINAVLRRIAENGLKLPKTEKTIDFLSVKYSLSTDKVKHFISELGYEKSVSVFEAFNGRKPVFIRHNNLRSNETELINSLNNDGVSVSKTDLDGCYSLDNTGDIASLKAFKKGYFHVQDISSQLCCKLLDARAGDSVIDCCAAPGGKSFTLAEQMENTGKIYSCDIYPHKIKLISEGANRLGIENISVVCLDARKLPREFFGADKVLCDVPCSGLGVIGRKPEIRYLSMQKFLSLPIVQEEILDSCSCAVKEGGTLVYSTCTINNSENRDICDRFLEKHPDFHISEDKNYRFFTDEYITLPPEKDGGDGFFMAKFIRGSA